MTSVKCPACGLVDWNVGDCKRCGTSLVGLDADGGYFSGPSGGRDAGHSVRVARAVVAACAVVALGLSALGALYLAHKPSKPQWFWSFYRGEPTPAEIFAHNLEVTGGVERLARLRSFRAEGKLTLGGEAARAAAAAGNQMTFVMHAKEPDRVEMEVEIGPPQKTSDAPYAVPRLEFSRDSAGWRAAPAPPRVTVSMRRGFDGRKGWEYVERSILTPGSTIPVKQTSARELNGEELGKMKHYARTTGLVALADAYTSLKLTGRQLVKWDEKGGAYPFPEPGREAYVLSGVDRDGKRETLYFDIENGLLLRVDFEDVNEDGQPVKVACHFDEYKEAGGLKLPHRMRFRQGEESATMSFEKYLPNEPIPDSTFELPE